MVEICYYIILCTFLNFILLYFEKKGRKVVPKNVVAERLLHTMAKFPGKRWQASPPQRLYGVALGSHSLAAVKQITQAAQQGLE